MSKGQQGWLDRLIIPNAIQNAIEGCSKGKIEDAKMKMPILSTVFDKIESLDNRLKQIPFDAKELTLNLDDIRLLENYGFLTKGEDGYYMPEIISHGLNFTWKRRKIRKIFQLLKRYEEI